MPKVDFLNQAMIDLKGKDILRCLREFSGPQGSRIILEGRQVVNFCSNDYLGLASDPRLQEAAIKALKKEGFGSGSSRLICGNLKAHRDLEEKIADFKKAQACIVFSTGYMANIGILPSFCSKGDIIFSDKLNHASIVDGILLSRAQVCRYPHKDMNFLESALKKASDYRKRIIVTDSVFSMDGDIALMKEIVSLSRQYDAFVMIDEAHAFGILGKKGSGAAELFSVEQDIDIQMGTLSKAAGSFGAYCCGSKELIDFFINSSRSFIYTTAMPPCVAAASLKAIEIMEKEPYRKEIVLKNAQQTREALKSMGFDTMQSQTPIIPVVVSEPSAALKFSQELLDQGIFVQAIRPPTVPPKTSRLRITITANHNDEDRKRLLTAFYKTGKKLCLI